MIIVHHTTAAGRDLRAKWLKGADGVLSQIAGDKEGDIAKTARIVGRERSREPDLRATLFLTTNQEPSEDLVRDVAAASEQLGFAIDIWSRVRLARVLDTDQTGQWIRRSLLGIDEEVISAELLREISIESIDEHVRPNEASPWVDRSLDRQLATNRRNPTFLVGSSGSGKTVACLRALRRHLEAGGFSLVLPHDIVETAPSLNAAILATLQRFRPALTQHVSPLSLCTAEQPLLLLVEDLNHAGNPGAAMEKLLRWGGDPAKDSSPDHWQLLCPLWQHTFNLAPEKARRDAEARTLRPDPFKTAEAVEALQKKAGAAGQLLTTNDAYSLANALGLDPLLVGLFELPSQATPAEVIADFVDRTIERCEASGGPLGAELHQALLGLGEQMLARRNLSPLWSELAAWQIPPCELAALRALTRQAEIIRLAGPPKHQVIVFRHDRVRDHLLKMSAIQLYDENRLGVNLFGDPFFAPVIAAFLLARGVPDDLALRLPEENPLALFHAIRMSSQSKEAAKLEKLAEDWLESEPSRLREIPALRDAISLILFESDGPAIAGLARLLPGNLRLARLARLRNGDIEGGVADCLAYSFYKFEYWRRRQIDHAKVRHGPAMRSALATGLGDSAIIGDHRRALLNLAGDMADPRLGSAIQASWEADDDRLDRLDAYLWAFSYCCTEDNAEDFLGPVCEEWAGLSTESKDGMPSPRDDLARDSFRWAFERNPPAGALAYFAKRGREDDLSWAIYFMMHGIDHPEAIASSVDTMASARRKSLDGYSLNYRHGVEIWNRRRDEYGEYMSATHRRMLQNWWQDGEGDEHRRVAAFDLWAGSWGEDDLSQLRAIQSDKLLYDRVLRTRLQRFDATAIPLLLNKLEEDAERWWFSARYVSSPALTDALARAIENIAADGDASGESNLGYGLVNILVRLRLADAVPILLRHQEKLSGSVRFVQCALYFATPETLEAARRAIDAAPDPKVFFKHLTMHFGIKEQGHPGVTRPEQIRGLAPYLGYIEELELGWLADACNDQGWFDLRRELLDPLLPDANRCWTAARLPLFFDGRVSDDLRGLSFDIDRLFESGVDWNDIFNALNTWLPNRSDEAALRLAAGILSERGQRKDLPLLQLWPGTQTAGTASIIEDATFAVCMRSPE